MSALRTPSLSNSNTPKEERLKPPIIMDTPTNSESLSSGLILLATNLVTAAATAFTTLRKGKADAYQSLFDGYNSLLARVEDEAARCKEDNQRLDARVAELERKLHESANSTASL